MLKHLDLNGALVTMDAMGTQTDIAHAIRDGGGDYCMSLKKNWPAMYADVEQLFNDPPEDIASETHETTDLTAGRIETRRHTVCHKVDWITWTGITRASPCSRTWPWSADRNRGRAKRQDRIRNPLLSVFACPLCFQLRTRCAGALGGGEPAALGVGRGVPRRPGTLQDRRRAAKHGHIRHTVLNLLSRARPTVSLKNRRKRAGWNVDYLETVIRQTA